MNISNAGILLFSTTILLSCSNKNPNHNAGPGADVKIKIGVVMKSGDIKNVARQDFIITKSDALALWKQIKDGNHKSDHNKDRAAIEAEVKIQLDYENTLKRVQDRSNALYASIIKLQNEKLVDARMIIGPLGDLTSELKNVRMEDVSYADIKRALNAAGRLWGNPNAEQDPGRRKILSDYYDRYEKLKKRFSAIDEPIRALENESGKHQGDIAALKAELGKRADALINKNLESSRADKEKAINVFQTRLKENTAATIKTNLNGEANIKLPKGKYFIFGIAQIGQSAILWNYQIAVDKESNYFELSNDNAAAIDNAAIISEMIEALVIQK